VSASEAGGTTSRSQERTDTARYEGVAKGHSKVTASDISACKASSVKSGGHRQSGWPVLIGRVNDKDYTPSNGHTPLSLGKKPSMGA
jgi:hypothetical protein